jgi:hypothetical protein
MVQERPLVVLVGVGEVNPVVVHMVVVVVLVIVHPVVEYFTLAQQVPEAQYVLYGLVPRERSRQLVQEMYNA